MTPTIRVKLPQKLYNHMEGSGFAAGDDYPRHRELFRKITVGEPLTLAEAESALDEGIESSLASLEAVAGSVGDFDEGRDVVVARRSAEAIARKLNEFLDTHTRFEPEVVTVQREIEQLGFIVRFVDYCEDADTPGLLGQIAGATNWDGREVKIATKGRRTAELVETLKHELHHVEDPTWDCGNRDVLGRGGARKSGGLMTELASDGATVPIASIGGDESLAIFREDGSLLVSVARSGQITYGEGYEPDEAARRFWTAMASVETIRQAFAS